MKMVSGFLDNILGKRVFLLVLVAALVGLCLFLTTQYLTNFTQGVLNLSISQHQPETSKVAQDALRFRQTRDELSRQLNAAKQAYAQQSCEKLALQQAYGKEKVDSRVSENGGWCSQDINGDGAHMWDQGFSTAISAFFKGKTVGSFGDGPGAYKRHLDKLQEVISYTAYDGAPYSEKTTNGTVKFLDLTAPQYGLPAFDWVISVEVGEHIPAKFEDVYIDNLARHAKEGMVLSWATLGQPGLSHVNNKALVDVISQMRKRGFEINQEAGKPLRDAAQFSWLRGNVHVYYRTNKDSFINEDV